MQVQISPTVGNIKRLIFEFKLIIHLSCIHAEKRRVGPVEVNNSLGTVSSIRPCLGLQVLPSVILSEEAVDGLGVPTRYSNGIKMKAIHVGPNISSRYSPMLVQLVYPVNIPFCLRPSAVVLYGLS